jgi:F-type H+-transporting ATPase subunit epsilon
VSQELPASIKLKVISSTDLLVDEEVQELFFPSLEGYLGIFPGHRPLFVAVGRGILTYSRANIQNELAVQGGYAEILPDRVLIFTEKNDGEKSRPPEEQG